MPPALQDKAKDACKQFRLMVAGSASLPTTVFEEWKKISGQALLERYGMTEVGMVLGNPLYGTRVKGTVGFPFSNVEVKIISDGKDVTDQNEAGELHVAGPQVFKEYHDVH
jgi:malonyl-CoA/methylmalonyl-CoA synthetase